MGSAKDEEEEQQPQKVQEEWKPESASDVLAEFADLMITESKTVDETIAMEEDPKVEQEIESSGSNSIGEVDDSHMEDSYKEGDTQEVLKEKVGEKEIVLGSDQKYLEWLRNDTNAQISLLKGILGYHAVKGEHPFANDETLDEFLCHWVQVNVVPSDFMGVVKELWQGHQIEIPAIRKILAKLP